MGLWKQALIYIKPLSEGKMGTILRLMANNGEISEAVFLEAKDRDKLPEPPRITALVSGILPNKGRPTGRL